MGKSTQQESSVPTMSVEDYVAAYAAASVGDKTRMRNTVTEAAMEAVTRGDMEAAAHYAAVSAALKAHRMVASVGPDYTQLASDLAATLEAAAASLRSGIEVPEVGLVRATEPGTPDADQVTKLATIKTRAARSGNGAVSSFIAEHVTDEPRTIAELLRSASVDGYRPSSGAIGACLIRVENGDEVPEGWEAVTIDRDGKRVRGAVAL